MCQCLLVRLQFWNTKAQLKFSFLLLLYQQNSSNLENSSFLKFDNNTPSTIIHFALSVVILLHQTENAPLYVNVSPFETLKVNSKTRQRPPLATCDSSLTFTSVGTLKDKSSICLQLQLSSTFKHVGPQTSPVGSWNKRKDFGL